MVQGSGRGCGAAAAAPREGSAPFAVMVAIFAMVGCGAARSGPEVGEAKEVSGAGEHSKGQSGPSPHLVGIDADREDWTAKTDAWWQSHLTAQEYAVCRKAGTERPGSGDLLHMKAPGVFTCSSCGFDLFAVDDKFESGTGWPSFTRPVSAEAVTVRVDASIGMVRTEALCGRCGAHLGHVFDDGPAPTGQRWCINSVCLDHRSGRAGAKR